MRLPERVTSDGFLIVTSLIIAFVIWMIAKRGDLEQRSFLVPYEIADVPENIQVRYPNVPQLKMVVNYPRSLDSQVVPGNFRIIIPWDRVENPSQWVGVDSFAKSTISVSVGDVVLAEGMDRTASKLLQRIQIASIDPSKIKFEAKYYTRPANLIFHTKGQLPDGYREGGAVIPRVGHTILLTASPAHFKALNAADEGTSVPVNVEEIDLTGRTEPFVANLRLTAPDETELLNKTDREIEAQVSIEPIMDKKTVSGVPIQINVVTPEMKAEYEPKSAQITVKAPLRVLRELTASDLVVKPVRNPDEVPNATTSVTLQASFSGTALPTITENTKILSVTPERLNVTYTPIQPAITPETTPGLLPY